MGPQTEAVPSTGTHCFENHEQASASISGQNKSGCLGIASYAVSTVHVGLRESLRAVATYLIAPSAAHTERKANRDSYVQPRKKSGTDSSLVPLYVEPNRWEYGTGKHMIKFDSNVDQGKRLLNHILAIKSKSRTAEKKVGGLREESF